MEILEEKELTFLFSMKYVTIVKTLTSITYSTLGMISHEGHSAHINSRSETFHSIPKEIRNALSFFDVY